MRFVQLPTAQAGCRGCLPCPCRRTDAMTALGPGLCAGQRKHRCHAHDSFPPPKQKPQTCCWASLTQRTSQIRAQPAASLPGAPREPFAQQPHQPHPMQHHARVPAAGPLQPTPPNFSRPGWSPGSPQGKEWHFDRTRLVTFMPRTGKCNLLLTLRAEHGPQSPSQKWALQGTTSDHGRGSKRCLG